MIQGWLNDSRLCDDLCWVSQVRTIKLKIRETEQYLELIERSIVRDGSHNLDLIDLSWITLWTRSQSDIEQLEISHINMSN